MSIVLLDDSGFELNLLFEGSKQPIEAFQELESIFQSLHDFDKWILSHVTRESNITYSLENIEYSSIKTKIAQILRVIPDDAISNLDWKKLIGNLLLKAKYLFLKKLEQNKTIDSKAILESLTTEVNSELKGVENKSYQIVFPEVNIYVLLNNIESITKVINTIPPNQIVEYRSKFGSARLSNGFFINKTKIITELGATTVTNETIEILKIKKIDLLSNEAKWEFKLGPRTLQAKILDSEWLNKYHKRDIILKPEDSLKVTLKTSYTFTSNNEHTQFFYEILRILSIVSPEDDSTRPELFT